MTSIKQQLYSTLVSSVTGVTWYGSDDNTDKMGPPPVTNPPTPFGYLRFLDVFQAVPGDLRQMIQIRIGDNEGRQYSRINAKLLLCEVAFARNPAKQFKDTATGEVWYFPEVAGKSPEFEDIDRPGYLIRTLDVMFRIELIPAVIAQTVNY